MIYDICQVISLIKFKGKVVHGIQKGTELGFPTLNLDITGEGFSLEHGVYSCFVVCNKEQYEGVMHYGRKSIGTDNHEEIFCEIHLINIKKNAYNEEVLVNVLKKIRNVREFDSEQALKKQIADDIKIAKQHFYHAE